MALATAAPMIPSTIFITSPVSLFMNCSASQPAMPRQPTRNAANDNGCNPAYLWIIHGPSSSNGPTGNLSNLGSLNDRSLAGNAIF